MEAPMDPRAILLSVLGLLCVACGGRAAATLDLGGSDRPARSDSSQPLLDRGPDTPRSCPSVKLVEQVRLEHSDTMKLGARIVSDSEGFALVWHSQLAIVSSLNGELRFARVDLAGKTSTPDGISLGSDNGALRAALSAGTGKYAVLHRPVTASAKSVELRQVDANGKTLSLAEVEGSFTHAAIAPHPLGHALLLAGGAQPQLLVVQDQAGVVPGPKQIPTAQVTASVWLVPRAGGFAAGLFTTNHNATLFLLGPDLAILEQTGVGHGQYLESPSFAVLANGFASVYGTTAEVESEAYDAAGQATGQHLLAKTSFEGSSETALVWTGTRQIAIYPGPGPNQYRAQVLTPSGLASGAPVPVPSCLATAREISAAWGGNRLAVATVSDSSGVLKSCVCVTLMACD